MGYGSWVDKMAVYITMFFLTLIFAIIYDYAARDTIKNILLRQTLFLFMCIPTIFVAAVRYDVGVDYFNIYWRFYESVEAGRTTIIGSNVSMDVGLRALNAFLLRLSDSPITFFIFSSILIYFSIFRYVKKQQERIMLSVMCFLLSGIYFTSLNIVRQFIAIAIVLWGWKFLKERKMLPYIGCCIFASLFHLSSLIMVVFYFLQYINITKKSFGKILVAAICATPIIKVVFEFIVVNTRYSYYLNNKLYVVDYDLAGTVYAILLTAFAFWRYKECEKKTGFDFLFKMLLCYDVVICMSYFIPLCNRISIYFKLFIFLDMLPMLITSFAARRKKVLLTLMCFAFMGATTFYLYYINGNSGVFPYTTIWSR